MNLNFINKQDIIDFFDFEAEAEKGRHIALMKLPVEDRVRKRKAIQNLSIDFNYAKTSEDGYTYFKLNATKNLSDFKEGDSLILHKGEYKAGQECTLSEFDEDDNIIISVYTPSSIINKEMWSD